MMGHLGDLLGRIWTLNHDIHVILSGVPPRAINLHLVESHMYNLDERKEEIGRYRNLLVTLVTTNDDFVPLPSKAVCLSHVHTSEQ